MEILEALEASKFAMFVKESSTAYTACLAFHTVGLAFLVGISGGTALRILGVARTLPLQPVEDFFPLMYAGFWINAVTGVVLLALYPTKYLTDPAMYIKLGAVVLAMVNIRFLRAHVFGSGRSMESKDGVKKAKRLAVTLMFIWLVAITAGRVTAYSLPTKLQTAAAVVVSTIVMLSLGYLAARALGRWRSSRQSA